MGRVRFAAIIGVCAAAVITSAAPARAANEEAVETVLGALKDEGVIDDAQYSRIISKNHARERESWWQRISWFGDFRFRHESFYFQKDSTGTQRDDRFRMRYRLRTGAHVAINDYADVTFRLATGGGSTRSRNQTIGDNVDFRPDQIRLDQAFATLRAPQSWFRSEDASARLLLGKMPNLFLWKHGRDIFPWDNDITPAGAALILDYAPADSAEFSLKGGYFVIEEFNDSRDPYLAAIRLSGDFHPSRLLTVGGQVTYYAFRSLDSGFIQRGETPTARPGVGLGGNLVGGLSDDSGVDVSEFGLYAQYDRFRDWPILVFARLFENWSAQSTPFGGKEDLAWGVGFEVGRSNRIARLGFSYWWVEANAFPGQFVDGTYTDSLSNRKGFNLFAGRQILDGTDLRVSFYMSDVIDDGLLDPDGEGGTEPSDSVLNAERIRITADVIFHF